MSPSSRRAWIEITHPFCKRPAQPVALLAEGVDRNKSSFLSKINAARVALLAEGVDRNTMDDNLSLAEDSRPPRGGRG